jgi:hypothetical protein
MLFGAPILNIVDSACYAWTVSNIICQLFVYVDLQLTLCCTHEQTDDCYTVVYTILSCGWLQLEWIRITL